jgi:cell division protein ZipA
MENYLFLGLLAITVMAIVLVWLNMRRNSRALGYENEPSFDSNHVEYVEPTAPVLIDITDNYNNKYEKDLPPLKINPALQMMKDDLLVISVMADSGSSFAAYDLLQAILATGMQFGHMNIFHYHSLTEKGNVKLFSLASATKPGDFDLDRMGGFSCTGLTLFANLRDVADPQEVFELMLNTADQLAEDLDGKLYAGHRTPWDDAIHQQYQQKILQYS